MFSTTAVIVILGLCALIAFLFFQVQNVNDKFREERVLDQNRITRAARLIVQSATQTHPLFAHEHALEAKIIIDDVIQSHGGLASTERNLKLQANKLKILRDQIYEQFSDVQGYIMDEIVREQPRFHTELNDLAGLNPKKKSKHNKRKRKQPSTSSTTTTTTQKPKP